MTDLEITKLCAEAMGLPICAINKEDQEICVVGDDDFESNLYDPLHDDAQAMALVKNFGLWIHPTDRDTWNAMGASGIGDSENLNRAICECVAKMQQDKSKE